MGITPSKSISAAEELVTQLDTLYAKLDTHIGGLQNEEYYLIGYCVDDTHDPTILKTIQEIDRLEIDLLYEVIL